MYSLKQLHKISDFINVIFCLGSGTMTLKSSTLMMCCSSWYLQEQVCLFPFVNKMPKYGHAVRMCLLVNNSYKAFSIYGVKHAAEQAMHIDDTLMLNPQTRVSHTFPTHEIQRDTCNLDFSMKRVRRTRWLPLRLTQAKMIWKLVSNQVSD